MAGVLLQKRKEMRNVFQSIPIEELEKRVGSLPFNMQRTADIVVSLRDIDPLRINSIEVMPKDYLDRLIRRVTLEGDSSSRPYADCEITTMTVDPDDLQIGQTFIQREKYRQILEGLNGNLDGHFCVPRGIAKRGPFIVFGSTNDGTPAIAHYLPPIVEDGKYGRFLLDGIHRNFLVKKVGTTIETILIRGVKEQLPCDPVSWSKIKPVDEKPPREERYFNLRKEFFRDLKYTGIDG
jgi:hypothetical protein